MKIGLHVGKFHWENSNKNLRKKLIEIAQTADKMDFSSFWVMDHLFQLGPEYGSVHGPVEETMLEGYTTISYLAAITKKIKMGLLVTCNLFRHPGLLIKMISTLDLLSDGRTYFGIGAGWFEQEAEDLGIPFIPNLTERFDRVEETLQIAKHMWSGNESAFEGKFYRLNMPINNPQPINRPHPPIIVGGNGEKRTLKLVAKYANGCNLVIPSPLPYEEFGALKWGPDRDGQFLNKMEERVKHKLSVLQKHCIDVGRPYEEIEKTLVTYIQVGENGLESHEIIELCQNVASWGIQHIIFNIPNVHTIEPIKIIGREVIPKVAAFD